jgi:hypothetical protein
MKEHGLSLEIRFLNNMNTEKGEVVKSINNKLFIIEDFLFPETCELLIKEFSKDLKNIGKPGIFGGPGGDENKDARLTSSLNKISKKTDDSEYNVAIDLFTSICTNIEKTASIIFKKDLVLRSYFYSHMKEGGKNSLHTDNYSEDYAEDFSAILYLSDSYQGGLISFPKLETKLRPKPGTLLTFIGNEELEHEVEEVSAGDRVNIICFLNERRNHEN